MMKIIKHIVKTIALLAIVFACSNNSENSQVQDKNELNNLKTEIEQLVSSATCSENSNCDFIAFGSKACGGPKSYLVFNNSIDVDLLKEKVLTYNDLEAAFNIKWGIISDCMAVAPPSNIECINGKCTIVN